MLAYLDFGCLCSDQKSVMSSWYAEWLDGGTQAASKQYALVVEDPFHSGDNPARTLGKLVSTHEHTEFSAECTVCCMQ